MQGVCKLFSKKYYQNFSAYYQKYLFIMHKRPPQSATCGAFLDAAREKYPIFFLKRGVGYILLIILR